MDERGGAQRVEAQLLEPRTRIDPLAGDAEGRGELAAKPALDRARIARGSGAHDGSFARAPR
jgi:hypothetical protein